MSGYIGTKAVTLSTTSASVGGDSTIGGDLTVDTNTLYVDSTNNRVGVGTVLPTAQLTSYQSLNGDPKLGHFYNDNSGAAAESVVYITNSSTVSDGLFLQTYGASATTTGGFVQDASIIGSGTGASGGLSIMTRANADMRFYTNGHTNERMRIDSSGNLLVGRTSQIHGGKVCIDYTNGTTAGMAIKDTLTSGTGVPMQVVNGSGSIVGSITQNQSSTSFNTTSDYRLKENVVELTNATDRVKQLEPKRFNFISDADTTVDGFLAHEVQTVVPEAITGTHNEVDDDGNAVMQGIDQSKLVPLLTAALKEAITKIEALETEMTSVKARLDALEGN